MVFGDYRVITARHTDGPHGQCQVSGVTRCQAATLASHQARAQYAQEDDKHFRTP